MTESPPTVDVRSERKEAAFVISAAKQLLVRHGEALASDAVLNRSLQKYRSAIQETRTRMEAAGVFAACAACASRIQGGCCFCGVEEWYDPVLLLINLLLGSRIPETREQEECCLFVGPAGCKLLAKHSFCLNYHCPSVKAGMRNPLETELHAVIGRELLSGWELEQAIRAHLALYGNLSETDPPAGADHSVSEM